MASKTRLWKKLLATEMGFPSNTDKKIMASNVLFGSSAICGSCESRETYERLSGLRALVMNLGLRSGVALVAGLRLRNLLSKSLDQGPLLCLQETRDDERWRSVRYPQSVV